MKILRNQRTTDHDSPRHVAFTRDAQTQVLKEMEPFVETQLTLLKPVADSWQPTDFLPVFATDGWLEEVRHLHQRARQLSDDLLVVLVGDTITEEALPSYQTMVNRHPGVSDETGASDRPWARWTRGWTAEENRHGEVLNTYLYLSGRVNMHAVDVTTQHLIRNGFDPATANDPYKGLIYTSFQERATRISHGNTAQLADQIGEPVLAKICQTIAGDEARHEEAYKRFVGKILELDASGAIMAFAQMMKVRIAMPGRLMADGTGRDVFERFSSVAQRIGVYTMHDYAEIIDHLVSYWGIAAVTRLAGPAVEAQDYLCGLAESFRRVAERVEARRPASPRVPCSWVFDRPV